MPSDKIKVLNVSNMDDTFTNKVYNSNDFTALIRVLKATRGVYTISYVQNKHKRVIQV